MLQPPTKDSGKKADELNSTVLCEIDICILFVRKSELDCQAISMLFSLTNVHLFDLFCLGVGGRSSSLLPNLRSISPLEFFPEAEHPVLR